MRAVVVSDRPAAGSNIIDGWHVTVSQRDLAPLLHDAPLMLSTAERARFDAMTASADLRRAAHMIKREAVGARLDLAPAAVAFDPDASRPTLLPPHADTHVSLSHTDGAVAVAVAAVRVGIDIEPIVDRGDTARLATRYFAADEARSIAALSDDARPFAFAWRWVAKEALLKVRGLSLGAALATPLGDGPRSDHDLPFACDAGGAHLTLFAPAAGFLCAVAR